MVSSINIKKPHFDVHFSTKKCIVPVKKIMLKRLVVSLENCLKDVPRRNLGLDKEDEERLPSTSKSLQTTTKVDVEPFLKCHDETVPVLNLDTIEFANKGDIHYTSSSDTNECEQDSSLTESLLLQLPMSDSIDKFGETKISMSEDDCQLGWEKLAEPVVCDVKTPVTSANSSLADLDLTPPSSVISGSSLFGERLTPLDDRVILDFDQLPTLTEKVEVDGQILADKHVSKELQVEVICFEPTLYQLQPLYKRRKRCSTATQDNCGEQRNQRLRPKSCLKQFIPFMFEQAKQMCNSRIKHSQKKRCRNTKSQVFHSTPKARDCPGIKKEMYEKRSTAGKAVRQLRINKRPNKKQLQLVLKQKETFRKKQLKMALQQKKEALKDRNKYENALISINRRLLNQNAFWRMFPR